jgi:glycosyltransferase involved in cell wall biosynthesis
MEMNSMDRGGNPARIAILLTTYNGSQFLEEQLASLAAQQWPALDVWVSDDGSQDGTVALLERWRAGWQKGTFNILQGPRRGFAENFRSLIERIEPAAAYYAYCDQDDVWYPDKLAHAIPMLGETSSPMPALYCSRTQLIDEGGEPMGMSPLFRREPSFNNALVQSIAGGNTMMMNCAAFRLLAESARLTSFVSHDWWTYLLVSGAGGRVVYDPVPRIGYRQHVGNQVGNNMGFAARLDRIRRLWLGQLVTWNAANLDGLARCANLLTPANRQIAERFRRARTSPLPGRFVRLLQAGVYRQTRLQTLTLWAAAALGRI